MSLLKPNIFQDIKPSGGSVYKEPEPLLNLNYAKKRRFPFLLFCKASIVLCGFAFFVFGFAVAPTIRSLAQTSPADERAALEAQLHDLETQIDQYQTQIDSYSKQGKTLKGQISQLNSKIAKLNLQIKAINLTLTELNQQMGETQQQITSTEDDINSNRDALASLVKNVYMNDNVTLVEIFLQHPQLSDFFGDLNNDVLLQGNLKLAIDRISALKDQLQEHQTQLSLAQADAQTIKAYQAQQALAAAQTQQQKSTLLAQTQGQESKYQALLKQTQETAAQIRNRIFQLLGGGQLTFQQAYDYARVASSATGVRAALILAVLDRESALGRNVGSCGWQQSMSPSNQQIFVQLMTQLHIDPNSVKVSCANADGAYGGAMGPAQFIPSTWELYADQIAKITGDNPPSPWNNQDAFTATALYLRDAGAANATLDQERNAAAKYYAGANWRRFTSSYGQAVINRAQQFEQDIATITQ